MSVWTDREASGRGMKSDDAGDRSLFPRRRETDRSPLVRRRRSTIVYFSSSTQWLTGGETASSDKSPRTCLVLDRGSLILLDYSAVDRLWHSHHIR